MGTTDIDKPWSTAPDHTRDGTTTDIPALRAAYVTQPVICYLPAPRDAPRFLSLPQIDPVEQTQPHPDPVQELAARAYLTKPRSHAVRSSSPCGVLPVELLREIFSYAIGDPSNHRGIMRISCVCEFWRAVVTDAPGFFIRANWDSWPSWLLESWCSRANGQPLTIQLGELGSTKALQPSQSEYRRVLQSTKAAWECLEVQIGHITTSERDVLGSLLFDDELPSLRRLRVAVPRWSSLTYPTIIPIRADLPTLQHLVLDGVAVRPFKQSLTLTHITINLSSSLSWSEWTQNIQLFAGITNLALTNIRPGNLLGHSLLELPSLTELLLESSPNDRTISSLFRSISIPNAHSVTLRDIVYYSNSDVLVALSQCAPTLMSLSIIDVDNQWLSSATRQLQTLCSLSNGEVLLPHLQELRLLRRNAGASIEKMEISIIREDTLQEFVASRRLSKLRLPTGFVSDECERELKGLVGDLTVSSVNSVSALYQLLMMKRQ